MDWWVFLIIAIPWTPIVLMLWIIIKKLNRLSKNKDLKNETYLYIVEDKDDNKKDDDTWH